MNPGDESNLPIDAVLPALTAALEASPNAVLEAPPGAGKTTRVPLILLEAPWRGDGRILMLEPRRAAARAAAARLAESLGESVGGRVGYRIRHESRIGPATRIEVITEGVLTRRLQSDPSLEGVAAVLFDEFHERSIHADLGLALCLEAQGALRPDLRLLAMSATLDGEAVAALMGAGPEASPGAPAPRIRAEGRVFPVETRWLERPLAKEARFERELADLTLRALGETEGDALVFLPGAAEIRRAETALNDALDARHLVLPLYGDLPAAAQMRALTPDPEGRRKIVLSTTLAETSLTIQGVRLVVDGGRTRRARFDPGAGLSRLITTRVSKASAEQRRGRAGRTAPGWCYRLWAKAEEGGAPAQDPAEILEADLTSLALDLAAWGAAAESLAFLDPPPERSLREARRLLLMLGALDQAGRITAHGKRLAGAPLHPRLAHMALSAGGAEAAFRLAALLEARDPLRGAGADARERLAALAAPERFGAAEPALRRLREDAKALSKRLKTGGAPARKLSPGALIALAFPDRIAFRRGDGRRYHLSGGKGAVLPEGDPLAREPLLAVAELGLRPDAAQRGASAEATIRLAAPVDRAEIETLFDEALVWREVCAWSKRDRQVTARRRLMLFEAALEEQPWPKPPAEAMAAGMLDGVRQLGLRALPWTKAARRLQARAALARRDEATDGAPADLSDVALLADLDAWLGPHLAGMRRESDLERLDILALLEARLGWDGRQSLDRIAPAAFIAPTGTAAPIDYGDAGEQDADRGEAAPPRIAIRLQELFGLTEHPTIRGEPLLIDLLSPAGRPIQTTADLPGFWRGSYADVAKEMRARYPKHSWPEDPAAATPTRRAKPRKGSQ